jgi:hypothetical protein
MGLLKAQKDTHMTKLADHALENLHFESHAEEWKPTEAENYSAGERNKCVEIIHGRQKWSDEQQWKL